MKKIFQIGIVVKDIEKQVRNWAEVLGEPTPAIVTIDGYEKSGATYKGKPTSAVAKQAIFYLGDISIELLEPVGSPSTWADFAKTNGQGIHHIAFLEENAEKEMAFYRRKNMNIAQQGHWDTGRYIYADSFDKLGAIIELIEFFPKTE
ncbi:MAG: VOC family protein [Sedimentisphaerales bacterium]